MPPGGHSTLAQPTTRVVLFHAPQAAPAKSLLAALVRPGVTTLQASHQWRVLAALLAPGAAACVVVLHEPGQLPHVAEVLDAIGKYARHAKIWIFDAAARPSLRAATESDLALLRLSAAHGARPAARSAPTPAPTPAAAAAAFIAGSPAAPIRTVSAAPPPLKLTDAEPGVNTWIMSPQAPAPKRLPAEPPALAQTTNPEQASPPPLLSAEELAMLLSDDPEKCT